MRHHTSTRFDDVADVGKPATPRSVLSSTRPTCGATGATFSFSSYESLYACGVCGAEFKEVVDAKNGVISSSKFVGDLVFLWSARGFSVCGAIRNVFSRTQSRYPRPTTSRSTWIMCQMTWRS